MTSGGLVVGYCHPPDVAHSFMQSWLGLMMWDLSHHRRLVGYHAEECGTQRVIDGRNSIVDKFLATDAEWLGMVDADMGFDPDAFDRLIEAADPETRPIVGGLCFGQRKVGMGPQWSRTTEPVPTLYRWVENQHSVGVAPMYDYPRDALVEVDATGAALFVAHRSVFVKIAERFPEPRRWFDETLYKGRFFSEDLTFCIRAREAGFRVWVHTGVKTSHMKNTYLEESTLGDLTKVPSYVVVPVKDRLDLTAQLVRQLERQGGWDGLFIMDNGSGTKTRNWLDTCNVDGLEVFDCDGDNIHQMWNRGIDEAVARTGGGRVNVAILNNDLVLGDNFVQGLAQALRSDPYLGVVGPNYDGRDLAGTAYVSDVCAGRYDGTGGLPGFAFMLPGEAGYRFPEELTWWFGDMDLVLSVEQGGMRSGITGNVTVEHVDGGSQTGDWDAPEIRAVIDRDQELAMAKWSPTREAV